MSTGVSTLRLGTALALAAALLLPAAPRAVRAQEHPAAAKFVELGVQLVRIPGGRFPMGSPEGSGEDEERPVHQVGIRDFYLGATEVTQAQWQAIMGANPAAFAGCDACPVESVSWVDAQAFLKALGAKTGVAARLPTEAEWEYAAGGGATRTVWAGSSDEGQLGDFAWFSGNAEKKTHPAGTKKPNALGLFDMSGNVWEWCQDWHDLKYYASSPAENPAGPARGNARILRGGSFVNSDQGVRVAIRHRVNPEMKSINLNGFRIAVDVP